MSSAPHRIGYKSINLTLVNPTVLDIPTDAYYAVDEIHDVFVYNIRMALQQLAPSTIFHRQSKQKKQKRSVLNIYYEISKIDLSVHYQLK
jgi:hypothetical protein